MRLSPIVAPVGSNSHAVSRTVRYAQNDRLAHGLRCLSTTIYLIMATAQERAQKLQATIDAQHKRLMDLKAAKAKLEARERSRLKVDERKKETRRLVLLGAFLKSRMEASDETRIKTISGLDRFLQRPDERALFDLLPNSSFTEKSK